MGSFAAPILIALILLFAIKNKIDIFNSFINGASDGINCIVSILPILVALVTSLGMLKASGAIDIITNLLSPIMAFFKFPPECVPLVLMKPISGSGSNAVLYSILETYGSESKIGIIASLIAGSSETILYIVSTYCGAIKVTKTKEVIIYAIIAFLSSVICATIIY